jgi:hypothetical protein
MSTQTTSHSTPAVAMAPKPKKSTPKTVRRPPAVATAPQPQSEIPQGNGGDGDPDNNGAPSDGDGGI